MLVTASYCCYRYYLTVQFNDSLTTHVKQSSLRLANSSRFETDDKANIGIAELIRQLEQDIQEIDKKILEIQTLNSVRFHEECDSSVAYLRTGQDFLRALIGKYKAFQIKSIAFEYAQTCLADFKKFLNGDLAGERRLSSMHQATCVDATAKLAEAHDVYTQAQANVAASAIKLQEVRDTVKKSVSEDALVSPDLLSDIAKKNTRNKEAK